MRAVNPHLTSGKLHPPGLALRALTSSLNASLAAGRREPRALPFLGGRKIFTFWLFSKYWKL
jgi:hypothetical protein